MHGICRQLCTAAEQKTMFHECGFVQADASMLSSIIMIQDLLIESQRPRTHPVHVVGVVRNPETVKVANYMVKDLAQGTMTAELLQPDELVSGLMAQVNSMGLVSSSAKTGHQIAETREHASMFHD